MLDRLAQIERWIADRGFSPDFSNLDFGDRFRGLREEVMHRYQTVADRLLTGGGPVLDLGCGRGELVELIVQRGGRARGAELDPELVHFCMQRNLDVAQADAFDALLAEDDGSLGGVALIQVVEHLTAQQLVDLIPLIHRKLAPSGVLAIETVNGTSPFVFTRSFYVDPTHTTPVHHEYLEFVLLQAGLGHIEIELRSPVAVSDKIALLDPVPSDDPEHDLVTAINERITALNAHLFGAQDYLMLSRKPAAE